MSDERRIRVPIAFVGQVIELWPDFQKWTVVAIEEDPAAVWAFSYDIDNGQAEASPDSQLALIRRVGS